MTKHSFALIICTYNRCKPLQEMLESLLQQDCNWEKITEIIIVDNNSTDGTEKLINSYSASFKTSFKHLKETRQGKSYALNLAIDSSKSDVLIFTDDDVILDPSWLREIIGFFEANDADVLGGRVVPLYTPQTPQWIKQNQYNLRGPIVSYDQGEGIIDLNLIKISAFIGANVAYKKIIFGIVGPYDIALGVGRGTLSEDIEMFERVARVSKKIFYNGKALVRHPIDPKRLTLRYLARWNFQHGKATAMLDSMADKGDLPSIGAVPRYLYRSVILKIFKLFFVSIQPGTFYRHWCALNFDLGRIAGYAKNRRSNAAGKG